MKVKKAIKIVENDNPERLAYGQTVWIKGTIRHSKGNYAQVELHDRVCGLNACRLNVHHQAVFESQ